MMLKPKSSLYAQYVLEREGKYILEDENGFATYFYTGEYCYIEDVYVTKEHRNTRYISKWEPLIIAEARSKGYSKLLTSVVPSANGSTESLRSVLSYGYKLLKCDSDIIYFIKEI